MIQYRSDMGVELVDSMGSDARIAQAARTSTGAENSDKIEGLVRHLLRERHGVPFEHVVATFRLQIPIFVARQLVKHRISSYSEFSGRYSEFTPEFWRPAAGRGIVNVGGSARPKMADGTKEQWSILRGTLRDGAQDAWDSYRGLVDEGIANEVARVVLPVSIYTTVVWTLNLRAAMNFLSLRVHDEGAAVESRPQAEIQEVAEKIEAHFKDIAPIAMDEFIKRGRVAP